MEKQEEKIISIDWLIVELTEVKRNLINKTWLHLDNSLSGKNLIKVFEEAKLKYDNEIKESFEKGYEEGVKYTDGLISNEKFPF